MTEEIAATPGWVSSRLDSVFAPLGDRPGVAEARAAYATCLAARKAPGAPSDMLGAEFAACRPALHQALRAAGLESTAIERLNVALGAVEAEIASGS